MNLNFLIMGFIEYKSALQLPLAKSGKDEVGGSCMVMFIAHDERTDCLCTTMK